MKRWLTGFTCVALVALGQRATRATEVAASPSALVNVVLIEIDTTSEAVAAQRFETGDWRFWEEAAPRLLQRLESDLGRVRVGANIGPEASLYSVRCAAASLDDGQQLRPLAEHLDGISQQTNRPSLLVVWLANQGCVLLASHGSQEQPATDALATLARVRQACAHEALGVASSAVAPPCVIVPEGQATRPHGARLDQTLRDSGIDALAHCVVLTELQHASSEIMGGSGPDLAPGAEFRLETLQTNVDRFYDATKTLYKVANIELPAEMQVPLAFAAPVMGDIRSAGEGRFHPLTSQSLERIGKFGMGELPKIIATLETQGRLPTGYLARVNPFLAAAPDIVAGAASQIGRGSRIPSVSEVTHYLDGVNKACWATVGALVAAPGGPAAMARGASIASTTAGLTADIVRGQTYTFFENAALDPVRKQMVSDFRIHVEAAVGHGVDAKTFSDMFTPATVSRMNFSPKLVAELDASARMANSLRSSRGSLVDANIRLPDRPPIPDDRIRVYKRPDTLFPPGGGPPPPGGGGAVPVTNVDRIMRNTFPRTYGLSDPMLRSYRPMVTARPAGILFHPELEIVADESGLTAAMAQQAVAAVKDTKAGGEFRFEGQSYLAVKAPGTANLFRVTAGRFQLTHHDLCLRLPNGSSIELNRYYDSGNEERSVLGQGWTFLPLALRVGQTAKVGQAGAEFAKKPVLVDSERAVELAYQMESPDEAASGPETEASLPQYRPVTSSFQPCLTARADGGYLLLYAHGLQAAFDRNGRLEWMGPSEAGRVRYTFASERLTEIATAGARVSLQYEENGRLCAAVTSDGQRVAYVLDDARRLAKVSGAADGSFVFTYDADNRLSRVQRLEEGAPATTLAQIVYDAKGRMLSQRTPAGLWTFRYDDRIGCVIATLPSGKDVSYYYNGKQQLVAYGSPPDDVTLFNYDALGRVFQVASGKLLNPTSTGERPRFKVTKMITTEI